MRRRDLLGGAVMAGAAAWAWPARAARARRLVTVATYGGWDTTYTFDPKIGVPGIDGPEVDRDPDDPEDREEIQRFRDIPVAVNPIKRPSVTAWFDRWADRTVVVNGLSIAAISHQQSIRRVLTGSGTGRLPDLGAVVGAARGGTAPLGYADLANQSFLLGEVADGDPSWTTQAGRLGERDQLRQLIDPTAHPNAPQDALGPYPLYAPSGRAREAMRRFLDDEGARYDATRLGEVGADRVAIDRVEARLRAQRLRDQAVPTARGLLNGAGASLANDAAVAVDGLSRGVWQAVLLDSRQPWDTHVDNAQQHGHWEATFQGLEALMAGLDAAGLLDEVMVVVISEMTRTPLRNLAGGKDHWPWASAMLIGGGISRGGTVVGATDDGQIGQPIDLASGAVDPAGVIPTYQHLAAGILARLDIDPAAHLPGVTPLTAI
jgi:hypothetical protein